jgi:hypothetical protein
MEHKDKQIPSKQNLFGPRREKWNTKISKKNSIVNEFFLEKEGAWGQ